MEGNLIVGYSDAARRAHGYGAAAQGPTSAAKDHVQTVDRVLRGIAKTQWTEFRHETHPVVHQQLDARAAAQFLTAGWLAAFNVEAGPPGFGFVPG